MIYDLILIHVKVYNYYVYIYLTKYICNILQNIMFIIVIFNKILIHREK